MVKGPITSPWREDLKMSKMFGLLLIAALLFAPPLAAKKRGNTPRATTNLTALKKYLKDRVQVTPTQASSWTSTS